MIQLIISDIILNLFILFNNQNTIIAKEKWILHDILYTLQSLQSLLQRVKGIYRTDTKILWRDTWNKWVTTKLERRIICDTNGTVAWKRNKLLRMESWPGLIAEVKHRMQLSPTSVFMHHMPFCPKDYGGARRTVTKMYNIFH